MDLPTKVWLANEIRIYGVLAAAFIGLISFVATWAHSRLQAELSAAKEEHAQQVQRESDEKIADAIARAAEANQKAESERLARVRIEQRLADRVLTSEQVQKITLRIAPYFGQHYRITTFWDAPEPLAFSNQLHGLLARSGWVFEPHGEGGSFLLGALIGIQVFVNPQADQKIKEAADAVVEALNEQDLGAQLKNMGESSPALEAIYFNIGTKR